MIWSVLLKPRYLCWDCSVHLFLPENHPLCFAFDTASVNCIWCPLGQNYDFPPFFFSFSCSQCEVPMTVRHVLQLIRNVFCDANGRLQCMPWAVTWRCPANWRALHDLEAQGKESAAASSTVGPWVRGILSFNNVLIYKSHAFFPAWLIVKE